MATKPGAMEEGRWGHPATQSRPCAGNGQDWSRWGGSHCESGKQQDAQLNGSGLFRKRASAAQVGRWPGRNCGT